MKLGKNYWIWAVVLFCTCYVNAQAATLGTLFKIAEREMAQLFEEMLDDQGIGRLQKEQILGDVVTAIKQLNAKQRARSLQISPEINAILEKQVAEISANDYVHFMNWASEIAAQNGATSGEKHYRLQFTKRVKAQAPIVSKPPTKPVQPSQLVQTPSKPMVEPKSAPTVRGKEPTLGELVETYRAEIRRMSTKMNEEERTAYLAYWRAFDSGSVERRMWAQLLLPMATMTEYRPEYGAFFTVFTRQVSVDHFRNLLQLTNAIRGPFFRKSPRGVRAQAVANADYVDALIQDNELNVFLQLLLAVAPKA